MPQSRVKYDAAALSSIGFPMAMTMHLSAYVASTNNNDAFIFPTELGADKDGVVARISSAQVFAQTPGDRTTGNYTYTLTQIDSFGNVIATVGTLTVPAAGGMTLVNLQTASGIGILFKAGQGLRLDTGAAPTGGTTNASNIRLRLFGEMYGISV